MFNPFGTSTFIKKHFDALDKHDANIRERLTIAENALETIRRVPATTKNEIKTMWIAAIALHMIHKLLQENTQD